MATGPSTWALELVDDHWIAAERGYLEMQSSGKSIVSRIAIYFGAISDVETAQGCWVMISSEIFIPKTKIP